MRTNRVIIPTPNQSAVDKSFKCCTFTEPETLSLMSAWGAPPLVHAPCTSFWPQPGLTWRHLRNWKKEGQMMCWRLMPLFEMDWCWSGNEIGHAPRPTLRLNVVRNAIWIYIYKPLCIVICGSLQQLIWFCTQSILPKTNAWAHPSCQPAWMGKSPVNQYCELVCLAIANSETGTHTIDNWSNASSADLKCSWISWSHCRLSTPSQSQCNCFPHRDYI